MARPPILLSTAVLSLALATPISAFSNSNIRTLYSAGNWSTMFGFSHEGVPVCMMLGGRGDRTIGYGSVPNRPYIIVQLIKKSWSIPPGTLIHLHLQVDNDSPWAVEGVGSGDDVKWHIQGNALRNYARQFVHGLELVITFEGGNEPPWVISLRGSAGATKAFARCIEETQPTPPATQPYTPAPTQPYPTKPLRPPQPREPYPPSATAPRSAPATPTTPPTSTPQAMPPSEPRNTIPPPTGYHQV